MFSIPNPVQFRPMKVNNQEFDIVVIGGGAAGLASAIQSAMMGKKVAIVDSNPVPGRKLSATGSGRGNLTNLNARADDYFCQSPESLVSTYQAYDPNGVRKWLEQMGIPTYATDDGWVYPYSESAANVSEILTERARQTGVVFYPHTLATIIQREQNRFLIGNQDKQFSLKAGKVIVAAGGPAAPQLGARDDLQPALLTLGHHINPFHPALAPIETTPTPPISMRGVRIDALVSLFHSAKQIAETNGNIIFTDWGVNGPGVMDVSHLINAENAMELSLRINLLPNLEKSIDALNKSANNSSMPLRSLLQAYLPPRAVKFVCETAGIDENTSLPLKANSLEHLLKTGAMLTFDIKAVRGYKFCQASAGGIPLHEIDTNTLESRIQAGVYFAGEILDVSGPCGGYNLQWAFASGLMAGRCAAAALD